MGPSGLAASNFASRKIYLVSALIIVFLAGCRKQTQFYRLIDHLSEQNIISSPLIASEEKFEKVDQQWPMETRQPLDEGSKETLAIPTSALVLEWNDQIKPRHMEVYQAGKPLPFLSGPGGDSAGWKWRRIEEYIEPERYRGYKRFKGAVLLPKDKHFISQEIFLPKGDLYLDIVASSRDGNAYYPLVDLYLNDRLIGKIPVGIYQTYTFIQSIDSGRYTIKIGFADVIQRRPYKNQEELLLDEIKVHCSSDLILLTFPEKSRPSLSRDEFVASYRIQPQNQVIYPGDFPRVPLQHNLIQLNARDILQKEVSLKSGRTVYEIIAFTEEPKTSIQLWLDDTAIGRQDVIPWRWRSYYFGATSPAGRHTLRIGRVGQEPRAPSSRAPLCIHRIIAHDPLGNTLLPLHKIKNEFPIFDRGIARNPFLLKKKLETGEYTVNALLAPPGSEYTVPLKIPGKGILQFGYGCLRKTWNDPSETVSFQIKIGHSGLKETLFSGSIKTSSSAEGSEFIEQKVDLSAYSGKNVKLSFITESPRANHSDSLSFWVNPVVYGPERKEPENNPNIILISLDTLRADHLGCYGYQRETSPEIDTLAEDGVVFQNTFSHSPTTLPSHMSMLTALYPLNHGLYTISLGGPLGGSQKLRPDIVTLAELLRLNDYKTAAFTGGAQVSSYFGFAKGFDLYQENKDSILQDTAERLYHEAADWIDKNSDQKFFLFLHTYQVHTPYSPPPPYGRMFSDSGARWEQADVIEILADREGKFSRLTEKERENLVALYDAEIRYTDDYLIKLLLAKLKELSLYDRTMIILTSDHGEEFYEHQGWEHGHTLYNELLRVPLIIKFPHSRFKGDKIKGTSRTIDITPTILDELKIDARKFNFDGESLRPAIEGKKTTTSPSLGFNFYALFSDISGQSVQNILLTTCIVQDELKLILNEDYPDPRKQSERFFWRIFPPPFPVEKTELYDIEGDPLEQSNLAKQDPGTVRRLFGRLQESYEKAKQVESVAVSGKTELNKNLEERLRALGYIR